MALYGCVSVPDKKNAKNDLDVFIFSSDDINEDVLGEASPVRVSILQLANAVEFNQMSELSANAGYKTHLGESVLDEVNFTIRPSSQMEFKLPLKDQTEYLGIVVAYRDLSKNWKLALYKQDKKWYQSGGDFLYLQVTSDGVIPLTKNEALTKIAAKKLEQQGQDLQDLTDKEKDKILKQLDKAMEDKKAADLKRGIFIEQSNKNIQVGE